MKRQIAKGLAMLGLTLALAASAAAVANGQTNQALKAQVPFEFVVGEKTLAAGQYDVRAIDPTGDAFAVTSRSGGDTAVRLASAAQRRGEAGAAKLVFHRYGSTYFLSQIWMAGEISGHELTLSKQERAMQRELKSTAAYRVERKPVYEIVEVTAR
ncbi:MAG TPA: hypothetical protein VE961_01265 [Pyrinomonadaceae bacterium]|nr:hypothetical protein [Pyrinomonadaceae bacterium]